MNSTQLKYQLTALTKSFNSCSILNADGALLYSKDLNTSSLCTTRLVAFQIIKKYLRPQKNDLFILNDPENGGFHSSKLIFVAALENNLFLVWDEDLSFIDFKIPPTPLYDQGQKNEFVWKALIGASAHSADFENFVLYQKYKIDQLSQISSVITSVANPKTQSAWLKATQEIFDIQFGNKAHSSFEAQYKINQNQQIKLKCSAEEKQNLKLFTADFTNTHLATDFHAASHVVESGLIKKIIDFYELGDFFTQAILDKIKIILPPRSVVSKPHPTGLYNLEIQSICSQLCEHILVQMNTHTRKGHVSFEYDHFLSMQFKSEDQAYPVYICKQSFQLHNIENLINSQKMQVMRLKRSENSKHIQLMVCEEQKLQLTLQNRLSGTNSNISLKLNDKPILWGSFDLKAQDTLELIWNY